MELALSLEKLNFTKLRELHDVADNEGDAQMCDFVEGSLLADQVGRHGGCVGRLRGGLAAGGQASLKPCSRAFSRGPRPRSSTPRLHPRPLPAVPHRSRA
jgi:hypothetical protein